jgi:hypothetical protein
VTGAGREGEEEARVEDVEREDESCEDEEEGRGLRGLGQVGTRSGLMESRTRAAW